MGHYVYKYVYNDKIIYIGKNDTDLTTRIRQHKLEEKFIPYSSSDIYYALLDNERDTDIMESLLIHKYKPCLNVSKKYDYKSKIVFIEPEWKKYCENNFIIKQPLKEAKPKKPLGERARRNAEIELENMFNVLSVYQYMYTCTFVMQGDELCFTIPKELDREFKDVTTFRIKNNNRGHSVYNLWKYAKCVDGIVMYILHDEYYQIFQDNYDLIIQQYKEEIKEFIKKKGLDYKF